MTKIEFETTRKIRCVHSGVVSIETIEDLIRDAVRAAMGGNSTVPIKLDWEGSVGGVYFEAVEEFSCDGYAFDRASEEAMKPFLDAVSDVVDTLIEQEADDVNEPFVTASMPLPAAVMPVSAAVMREIEGACRKPGLGVIDAGNTPKIWTAREDKILLSMIDDGKTTREIAEALGRTEKAVSVRRGRLRQSSSVAVKGARKTEKPIENKKEIPVSSPDGNQSCAEDLLPTCDNPVAEPKPLWWREIEAELNALGNKAPWTPELDLELVDGIISGTLADVLADQLGVEVSAFRERFIALTPNCYDRFNKRSVTVEHQVRLRAVLRSRIGK